MKLDQLGLKPAGKAATAKLGKQVHKATVAAAMEPKLRLGVVGIEIGQEQSKGLTSRINEDQALSAGTLIRKLGKLLDIQWERAPTGDADWDEACEDAVKLLKLAQQDRNKANTAVYALVELSNSITGEDVSNARGHAEALTTLIQPVDWFKTGCDSTIELAQKATMMRAHAYTTRHIYEVLDYLMSIAQSGKETKWSSNYKITLAVFKKLGVI